MPPAAAPDALAAHWLAETVRIREAHWGPLEDSEAVRQALRQAGSFEDRVLLRARALGEREGLPATLRRWRHAAFATLALLACAAVLAGAGAATAALGDGSRPTNVLWALGTLLGLHLLTLLLWLSSFLLGGSEGSWLGQAWLWMTRRLARGPDAALAPQALTALLARNGSLRWLLGAVSHAWWLVALVAALLTLLVVLSTRRYGFAWETTLLHPETFVRLTHAVGWLPAQLGFPLPDAATVRASDGMQALPPDARTAWSGWLIGALAVYGIAPRLLAWALCAWRARRSLRRLGIDPALPGYANLRERLAPSVERLGIDAPDDRAYMPRLDRAGGGAGSAAVMAGIELPPDLAWPPFPVAEGVHCPEVLDTREQRKALLDALSQHPPARLLLACDARQTPDRGSLALIVELAALAARTGIWLMGAGSEPDRTPQWRERLAAAGLAAAPVLTEAGDAARWLEHGDG